jgi:hypothetical protein
MNNLKLLFVSLIAVLAGNEASAQFSASEYLDINQIKASHMVHGDMWYNPGTGQPECEYPKGTGKHANYAGGLWLSGLDNAGNMRAATTLFRTRGLDFMPGPLDAMDTISLAASTNWARIWKIDARIIGDFMLLYKSGGAAAITASKFDIIKEWPAKGNIDAKGYAGAALTISDDMAPFVDANSDGIYNWRDGDYPKIKGDQMLWWVINDNGTIHTMSKGKAMKIEIHIAAYAYNRGSAVDRMLFYEYTLLNKSDQDYTNFRLANWTDTDLGNPFDDYIGIDSAYRMGVTFQGDVDGPNGLNSYGANAPIAGFSLVEMPGDTCLKTKMPIGSITTFRGSISGPLRDPVAVQQFYNYMNSMDADANPMGLVRSTERFFSDMKFTSCDTLLSYKYMPSDKRYTLSSSGITFPKNTNAKYSMIFMVTDTNQHICPNLKYDELRGLADTAWRIYCNPLPLSISNQSLANKTFHIYPNPAETILYLQTFGKQNKDETIRVIDALGKTIVLPVSHNADKYAIDISHLAAGIYSVLYFDSESQSTQTFVKQ